MSDATGDIIIGFFELIFIIVLFILVGICLFTLIDNSMLQKERVKVIIPEFIDINDHGCVRVVDINGIKYMGDIVDLYKLQEGDPIIIYYKQQGWFMFGKDNIIERVKLCNGECKINHYEYDDEEDY